LCQEYGPTGQVFNTLFAAQYKSMKEDTIMNAIVTDTSREFEQLKTRLKAMWMAGNYDVFSRFMEKDAEQFFRRLGVSPGTRLLDVGCGAGQLALIAARAGAHVVGCDIATNWLERARTRAAVEGLEITFEEADAESLPYDDAQFDVVTSLIGAMFAPRPDRVAAELTRVCGRVERLRWQIGLRPGSSDRCSKRFQNILLPPGCPRRCYGEMKMLFAIVCMKELQI